LTATVWQLFLKSLRLYLSVLWLWVRL
jgi:hypothetical protein